MTNQQILAIQSYILACVKYETAHYSEKGAALLAMVNAQGRMHDLLLDRESEAVTVDPAP